MLTPATLNTAVIRPSTFLLIKTSCSNQDSHIKNLPTSGLIHILSQLASRLLLLFSPITNVSFFGVSSCGSSSFSFNLSLHDEHKNVQLLKLIHVLEFLKMFNKYNLFIYLTTTTTTTITPITTINNNNNNNTIYYYY